MCIHIFLFIVNGKDVNFYQPIQTYVYFETKVLRENNTKSRKYIRRNFRCYRPALRQQSYFQKKLEIPEKAQNVSKFALSKFIMIISIIQKHRKRMDQTK